MEGKPAVSVVMPAFNAEKTIAASVESVVKQSYKNWELLIVDDGSNDDTGNIVKSFQTFDSRIKLVTLKTNGGLPNARNQGCKAAAGNFIAFLDSDDLWHRDKLFIQMQFHAKNKTIEISHTDFDLFNDHGIINRPFKNLINPAKNKTGQLYPQICYQNTIGVLTVIGRKTLFESVNFFDSELWTLEDQDLWVRLAKKGNAFGYIPKVLAYYRTTATGITGKIGRYKKAYKVFIKKISSENLNCALLWRSYFRYFGTAYYKKGQYELSVLYFWKSFRLKPYDFIGISTLLYLSFSLIRHGLKVSATRLRGLSL